MSKFRGTVGQLLVDQALPEAMRGRRAVLTSKGLTDLLAEVGRDHPDQYRQVSHRLLQIGKSTAQESGGASFDLSHLRKSDKTRAREETLRRLIERTADADGDGKTVNDSVVKALGDRQYLDADEDYADALAEGNPLAAMIASGSRGNRMNLQALKGSEKLYTDFRDQPIPFPVLRSYSQGLTPTEYYAGTYGARKGVVAVKKSVAEGGFLGKQLVQSMHRLVVVDTDGDGVADTVRGLPVDVDDPDNEGSMLGADVGQYKRNTMLTPKILKELKAQGIGKILVRSPTVGGPAGGGVYANDVGVREYGRLPGRGEFVGIAAGQALGEPIAQGGLSSKHSGGVAGQNKTMAGFKYLDFLMQHPRTAGGAATHAEADGRVHKILPGAAGGWHVFVGGKDHYVSKDLPLKVKVGDDVEAGDVLSEGMASPARIAEHKGIGEARRYFTQAFREGMKNSGSKVHRRNVELAARGLFDHVELEDEHEGRLPGDVVSYSALESTWKPRAGSYDSSPDSAQDKYLEKPYLHYSIGTRVRPSVRKELQSFGVQSVKVHDKPPPWKPIAVRAMYNLKNDDDWMVRQYSSGLKEGLLDAAHRGAVSDREGTSFVPSLAYGVEFGKEGPWAKKSTIDFDDDEPFGDLVKTAYGAEANAPGQPSISGGAPTVGNADKSRNQPATSNAGYAPGFGPSSMSGGIADSTYDSQMAAPKAMMPPQTPSLSADLGDFAARSAISETVSRAAARPPITAAAQSPGWMAETARRANPANWGGMLRGGVAAARQAGVSGTVKAGLGAGGRLLGGPAGLAMIGSDVADSVDEAGYVPTWLGGGTLAQNNQKSRDQRFADYIDPNQHDGYLGGVGQTAKAYYNPVLWSRTLTEGAKTPWDAGTVLAENAEAGARSSRLDAEIAQRQPSIRASQDKAVELAQQESARTGEGLNPSLIKERQALADKADAAKKGWGQSLAETVGGWFT